jgi:regulator of sigma E protease
MELLIFVIVLGGMLIAHEFGHFAAAKLLNVRVDEFGLGFPPRLATLFEAGGTKFSINWIPFGGFVRLAGEDDPRVEGGLASASKKVRTAVLLAGPVANVLVAFFAFTAAHKFAAPDEDRVLITRVNQGTPAEEAGILPGDIMLAVDDIKVDGYETMAIAISERKGIETQFTLERDGQIITVNLIPRIDHPREQGPIGVGISYPPKDIPLGEAIANGAETLYIQFDELIHLPGRLIRGEIEPEQARLSGLKGMYDIIDWAVDADRAARRPFATLYFTGVIGLGLALANLLPFPALDGGRLLFILIEFVIGRRIDPQYEGLAHTIGFAVLIVILIYVNFLDFIDPIPLP